MKTLVFSSKTLCGALWTLVFSRKALFRALWPFGKGPKLEDRGSRDSRRAPLVPHLERPKRPRARSERKRAFCDVGTRRNFDVFGPPSFGFFCSGVWGLLNPNRACPGCGGGFGQTTNEDHVGPRPRSAPPGATCLAPLDTTQSHPPPLHGRGCDCGRGTATEERAISIETLNPKP